MKRAQVDKVFFLTLTPGLGAFPLQRLLSRLIPLVGQLGFASSQRIHHAPYGALPVGLAFREQSCGNFQMFAVRVLVCTTCVYGTVLSKYGGTR